LFYGSIRLPSKVLSYLRTQLHTTLRKYVQYFRTVVLSEVRKYESTFESTSGSTRRAILFPEIDTSGSMTNATFGTLLYNVVPSYCRATRRVYHRFR
jgi:hypothetical protein